MKTIEDIIWKISRWNFKIRWLLWRAVFKYAVMEDWLEGVEDGKYHHILLNNEEVYIDGKLMYRRIKGLRKDGK